MKAYDDICALADFIRDATKRQQWPSDLRTPMRALVLTGSLPGECSSDSLVNPGEPV